MKAFSVRSPSAIRSRMIRRPLGIRAVRPGQVAVPEQVGWRHFLIEKRLLELGGDGFRSAIKNRRRCGMKTEPAFAEILNLRGDPYQALLDIESWSNDALTRLLPDTDDRHSTEL
ncbi:DUF4269 domain-containing protein [Erythrobacter sp. W302b]|uniref:DUF4269 domain-containing protein n=1 Tax=Erythrobacter sp. W302b TaxID=3389874 RepID=UPI00396B03E4